MVLDVGQGEDLLESRHDGELLRLQRVHPGPVEHGHQPLLDVGPDLGEALGGLELLTGQIVRDRRGPRAEGVLEGVGQRVRGVRRQDERARPGIGAPQRRRRRDRRLADTALAREEKHPP